MNIVDTYYPKVWDDHNIYEIICDLGKRLRVAMGEKEILPRNERYMGEFRPPTYRSYAESLNQHMWNVCRSDGRMYHILPYSNTFDSWKNNPDYHRAGFMAISMSAYEYAYEYWDDTTNEYYPNLLENDTFGAWLELLPEPASVIVVEDKVTIRWNATEPRVYRSSEMGRYCLPQYRCYVDATSSNWRLARAEAYVKAWERMASNEPDDRYESVILAEQDFLKIKWNSRG